MAIIKIRNAAIDLDAAEIPNLDTAKITSGTMTTARLGSGTASSSTFLRGDSTFASASSAGIDDNATSTAITINSSEQVGIGNGNPQNNLDIATNDWDEGITIKTSGNTNNSIISDANRTGAGGGIQNFQGRWNGTEVTSILFQAGSDTTNKDDGEIIFRTASAGTPTERVKIHNNGVMSAVNGIALGVGNANTVSNVLDDYEEGTFTPTVNTASGFSTGATNYTGTSAPRYTKIGNRVFLQCQVQMGNSSGNVALDDSITMTGLPFTPADVERNTVTEYRYNTDVAYMTSYLNSSGAIFSTVRFLKGTPQRSGGSINININYTV